MDFVPSRDDAFDPFANNFKTLIAATPANYGLVAADGLALTNAYDTWHTAFLNNLSPTRNHGTVVAKNNARDTLEHLIRSYGATIRANHAVSDELKAGLGLHLPSGTHTPVPPPATKPVVAVVFMDQGVQKIRAKDEGSERRGRAPGSAGMLVWRVIAADAVTEPSNAEFVGFVSKPEVTNTFGPSDNGKTVTYFARWTNGKGELGPWSDPVSKRIAA